MLADMLKREEEVEVPGLRDELRWDRVCETGFFDNPWDLRRTLEFKQLNILPERILLI
jgi:hypothetical protein